MGATIWSMHFVAMMAVDFPIMVTYNLVETIGSIGIAIVATGGGLYLASSRRLGGSASRSAASSWDSASPACTILA